MHAPLLLTIATALAAGPAGKVGQLEVRDVTPTLTVGGEASVAAQPDLAIVTLGASAQGQTAALAQSQVNSIMERAIAAIRESGAAEKDIQTAGISLSPVYSQPQPRQQGQVAQPGEDEPRIVGYRASNTVRVRLEDLALVGGVIDAGIGAGANELQGISFELRDDTPQRAEALRQAVHNARHKAQALAEASGVRLLTLQQVDEGDGMTLTPQHGPSRMMLESATPVQAGQVHVRASVTLSYRIRPADQGDQEQKPAREGRGADDKR